MSPVKRCSNPTIRKSICRQAPDRYTRWRKEGRILFRPSVHQSGFDMVVVVRLRIPNDTHLMDPSFLMIPYVVTGALRNSTSPDLTFLPMMYHLDQRSNALRWFNNHYHIHNLMWCDAYERVTEYHVTINCLRFTSAYSTLSWRYQVYKNYKNLPANVSSMQTSRILYSEFQLWASFRETTLMVVATLLRSFCGEGSKRSLILTKATSMPRNAGAQSSRLSKLQWSWSLTTLGLDIQLIYPF